MITKATRQTRPLIEYPAYFEQRYCFECMQSHFVEITRANLEICHGANYYHEAQRARTHYARRLGRGFELVPLTRPGAQMPLDWMLAAVENEPEYIDIDQDW